MSQQARRRTWRQKLNLVPIDGSVVNVPTLYSFIIVVVVVVNFVGLIQKVGWRSHAQVWLLRSTANEPAGEASLAW